MEPDYTLSDATQFSTWKELVKETWQVCQQVTDDSANTQLIDSCVAELLLLRKCQAQSFPEETTALKTHKPIPNDSQLLCLAPEWDPVTNVIRVGGRLQRL